ncbi:MarR family transcriptional regulator [Cognatishimia sp. WU-CL00825]|uniref:MarR family winged helix-turn-helix transcriptional regulator n=1 Tax=Cognatishimia sp. WU-CL00825 TaxID=3127658 RepID=UPI003105B308
MPLSDTMHQIHRLAHQEWSLAARDIGMSFNEFEYLSAVQAEADLLRYEDKHGQHLQDIVETLGVTKASASTMIAKLEVRGLVKRFPCRMDARAQHIILTDEGQILMGRGKKIYEKVAASVQAKLGKITLSAP